MLALPPADKRFSRILSVAFLADDAPAHRLTRNDIGYMEEVIVLLLSLGLALVLQDHAAPPAPTPIHAERWISSEDMPRGVERFEEARTVGYVLEVDAQGQVTRCAISQPTDSWRLDTTTCRLLRQRAQFQPARDAEGNPVPSLYRGRFAWQWSR